MFMHQTVNNKVDIEGSLSDRPVFLNNNSAQPDRMSRNSNVFVFQQRWSELQANVLNYDFAFSWQYKGALCCPTIRKEYFVTCGAN